MAGHGLWPPLRFLRCWAGAQADWARGCPRSGSSLPSPRGPEQAGGLEDGASGGTRSHPPCLLLTGGQAGADCTRCRPSGRWQISPAAGPPRCAAPHPGGLVGRGRQCGGSKAVGAKTRSVRPREGKWPANRLPEPEAPRQGREGSTRRVPHPTDPRRSQSGAPSWLCSEWGQGHLGRAGVGLPPPPAIAEGGASEREWGGGEEWPGRTGGVITWGEKRDGLHQHILLLMQLQLLQPVVELQHGLQEKLLEATCRWVEGGGANFSAFPHRGLFSHRRVSALQPQDPHILARLFSSLHACVCPPPPGQAGGSRAPAGSSKQ